MSLPTGIANAQRIVDTLHEPLLVLDAQFRVRQANPAFYRAFDLHETGTLDTVLFDLPGGLWVQSSLRVRLRAVVERGEAFEGLEIGTPPAPGPERVLRLNGRRLAGSAADPPRILLAIQDVTEQRALEAALRRHSRELERSNADLEQFAFAASHDLQEPLRMVASYLQLLERRYGDQLDGEAREFMDYAIDGAQRMKALISGLLAYSRVGRTKQTLGEVDLDELVDGLVDDLRGRIGALEATVTRDALPVAYGSRDQLHRLLKNLLENALTYHGDAPPAVHVTSAAMDNGVHLVVRDRGPGIPPEHHDAIFQIFRQLDPHGAGHRGTGMGLALCRKIAEHHDGTIWVESAPGEGAAFHVTLHLTPETAHG